MTGLLSDADTVVLVGQMGVLEGNQRVSSSNCVIFSPYLSSRGDIEVEALHIAADPSEVLPTASRDAVLRVAVYVADLDIPVSVGPSGRASKGNFQVSGAGATNINVHVLAGGNSTDNRGIVVGKSGRSGRGKAVAASDGPAVKVALSVAKKR